VNGDRQLVKGDPQGQAISLRGGGGIRKIRFAAKGKGKSGGVRVIYYILKEDRVFLLLAYPKNEQENLTAAQLKLLSHTVNQML
jgi:hypothetical protein